MGQEKHCNVIWKLGSLYPVWNSVVFQYISHLAQYPSTCDSFTDKIVFNTRLPLPGTPSKVRVGGNAAVALFEKSYSHLLL